MKGALVLSVLMLTASAGQAVSSDNLSRMAEAARGLEWEYENKAFFLVKRETIRTTVAVVFGYADNGAACYELARTLSDPRSRAGTFDCVAAQDFPAQETER